jgi:hypothetical protein
MEILVSIPECVCVFSGEVGQRLWFAADDCWQIVKNFVMFKQGSIR